MTASPFNFLDLVRLNVADLTPTEQADLLAFADEIDPAIGIDALTSLLRHFLLAHETIDSKLDAHTLRGIAGQPVKVTPKAAEVFKTTLRNLVLHIQQKALNDGGTTSKS